MTTPPEPFDRRDPLIATLDRRMLSAELQIEAIRAEVRLFQQTQQEARTELRALIGDLAAKLATVLSAMERENGAQAERERLAAKLAWVKSLIPYGVMAALYLASQWVKDITLP